VSTLRGRRRAGRCRNAAGQAREKEVADEQAAPRRQEGAHELMEPRLSGGCVCPSGRSIGRRPEPAPAALSCSSELMAGDQSMRQVHGFF
jgi:hypothetical protein